VTTDDLLSGILHRGGSGMAPKTVDDYVAGLRDWRGEVVSALRKIVLESAPKAQESIKWAQPVYDDNGPFAWIKAHTHHVNIGFWRGAELADPKGILQGDGDRMRHIKLTSLDGISGPVLKRFVKEAVKLNRALGYPTQKKKGSM
jgi:hypothetical protein